ncbi:MFS transporter [Ktedonobacter sp. SOSP1-52]|uniref:MDR family MFS transporter n=1 Tax=Ktedonobacter sp. SOSP1-52 TaxID=2778366 RepID=UPI001914EA32|nr:MFS transporter [Ktedonobacter sp. SOSP1-52]GHO71644.1 MFS transporter [Ktedonobacter sp. SOSP1-52]
MQPLTKRFADLFENWRFSRPFWLLSIGSFINRVGRFVIPFFALYLTSARHLTVSEATLVISLIGLGSLFSGVCGGMLADIFGRRVTILISLFMGAAILLILGFVSHIALIVGFAVLYAFFNDLASPAISATIADTTPPQKIAQAYSLRYWINNIASAIGPVLAGLLAPISYLLLFLGDALTTLCFGLLIWLGLSETHRPRKTVNEVHMERPKHLRVTLADPWLWSYALLGFLFECVYMQCLTAIPLDMQAHGLGPLAYGSINGMSAIEVVLVSLPVTAFCQRFFPNTSLSIAALLLGIGMGLFSVLHTYTGFLLGVAIWTLGEIPYFPTSIAVIANISPAQLRGTYQGVFQTIRSLSVVAAPAFGGLIIQHWGASILWRSCFVIGLLVAVGYFALGRIYRNHRGRVGLTTSESEPVLPAEVLKKG